MSKLLHADADAEDDDDADDVFFENSRAKNSPHQTKCIRPHLIVNESSPICFVPVRLSVRPSVCRALKKMCNQFHGDPTDMRESTSVFQVRTINWSKLDK